MNINGQPFRTIWLSDDGWSVQVIDQTRLPHAFTVVRLATLDEAAVAIRSMIVRGAPLIGAAAAYGLCLAVREDPSDEAIEAACRVLNDTRPTAINLRWAMERMRGAILPQSPEARVKKAYDEAATICDEDVETNRAIAQHGVALLKDIHERRAPDRPINVLTHCNAGWLATVDWGTALAPIYLAHEHGLPVHVWVDETRPRNQGASLTAWELGQHGVPHTLVADNVGGHLMQHGMVDCCITGTDRTTGSGDVCNKIGTYLKALAARDNDVPFYVALPGSTIDWSIGNGLEGIPIEQRDQGEVSYLTGVTDENVTATIRIAPADTMCANYAFDVTPARLVTALITERGVCEASAIGLSSLYPEATSPDT